MRDIKLLQESSEKLYEALNNAIDKWAKTTPRECQTFELLTVTLVAVWGCKVDRLRREKREVLVDFLADTASDMVLDNNDDDDDDDNTDWRCDKWPLCPCGTNDHGPKPGIDKKIKTPERV